DKILQCTVWTNCGTKCSTEEEGSRERQCKKCEHDKWHSVTAIEETERDILNRTDSADAALVFEAEVEHRENSQTDDPSARAFAMDQPSRQTKRSEEHEHIEILQPETSRDRV